MPNQPSRNSGFLYIEALIGVCIMAFILLALGPLFIVAARENASSSDMTYAATLATDRAETLKDAAFGTLAAGTTTETFKQHDMKFSRSTVIADNSPHPGMKTITVTVTPSRRVKYGQNRIATVRFYRAS